MRHSLLALALLVPALASAQGTAPPAKLTLGVGVVSMAAYPGSDDRRVLPLPIIALDLGRVYVGGGASGASGGAGLYLTRGSRFTWTVDVGGTMNRPADISNELEGFADRGFGSTVGTSLSLRVGPLQAAVSAAVGLKQEVGMHARASLGVMQMVGSRLVLNAGLGATMSDAEHMAWDFGVSAPDAVGSGMARYAPRAGLRDVSATVSPVVLLGPRLMVAGFASVTWLADEAARSPLVKRRTAVDVGVAIIRPL